MLIRHFSLDFGKISIHTIEFGVPQGSILGLLLFLIYINDLPLCLQTIPRFYVDDTALLISGLLSDVQVSTNLVFFIVSQCMQANSLIVNTAKTVALIIAPQLHLSIPSANVTLQSILHLRIKWFNHLSQQNA